MKKDKEELQTEIRKAERMADDYRELRKRAMDREKEFKRTVRARVNEVVRDAEDQLSKIVVPIKNRHGAGRDTVLSAKEKIRDLKSKTLGAFDDDDTEGKKPDFAILKKGDKVLVMPIGIEAVLMENPPENLKDDTKLSVQMGKMKVKVASSKIKMLPADKKDSSVESILKPKRKNVNRELALLKCRKNR